LLLEDEHPALRRSFRSKHFGGALEREVLRLIGRQSADGRLTKAWHWMVPLGFVWLFILVMIFKVLLPRLGVRAPLYNTYLRDPIEAYVEISQLFAVIMTFVIAFAQPVTHLIAAWVTRGLRHSPEIQDLSLSAVSRRELASALWMRLMVGYRVFEVFGALNLGNLLLAYIVWNASGRMTLDLPGGIAFTSVDGTGLQGILLVMMILTLVYTPGVLGARRGALDGLVAGMLDLRGMDLVRDIMRCFVRQSLITLLLLPAIALLLPVIFMMLLFLGFADYPLLYMLVGRRDFERLVSVLFPFALVEGIAPAAWNARRHPQG